MMKKGELLSKAISIAVEKHAGHFDKGGNPYILHCITVMLTVDSSIEEVKAAAVLHDVIEDTDATYKLLAEAGMTERIIKAVCALTKQRGQTYEEYKQQVKSNPDAVIIKMADLRHNSDITRLKGVSDKDVQRIAKYMQFYTELKELV